MKPKEKALQLIDKFENYSFMDIDKKISSFNSAKQCALIAVDEMIEELIVTDFANRFPYWQEVKEEIEKL
jgi:hypothetical protein